MHNTLVDYEDCPARQIDVSMQYNIVCAASPRQLVNVVHDIDPQPQLLQDLGLDGG